MARLTLFLSGDVMTGRGVDQVLPSPGDPTLRERYVADAREYVALAEAVNGPIPRPVGPAWPWGEALPMILEADVRVLNVETAVTTSSEFALGKAVCYRMHPRNVDCLAVARPDVCALANNHVLDFGPAGLVETLQRLDGAGLAHSGAGRTLEEATRPVMVRARDTRVVVHVVGTESAGVPPSWAATPTRPGVALADLSDAGAQAVLARVRAHARAGDVTVVSVHAGSNWGYRVPRALRRFAHALVDGGVDVVHCHSSHHARPIEVHRDRAILYGCGDLINDYEGIGGHEEYRSDLRLLPFVTFDDGRLAAIRLVPLRARRLSLERAGPEEVAWLRRTLLGRGTPSLVELLDGG